MKAGATHLEPDLGESRRVDNEPAVEDERGLLHVLVHLRPVDLLELLPLGRDHDRLRVLARLERRLADGDLLFDCATD